MAIDLSQYADMEIKGTQEVKKKGVVDIIFLLDVSGSMGPAIISLAKNIETFVETLKDNNVEDWRAKVYTFSDLEFDSPELALNFSNKYVSEPDKIESQLVSAIELVKQGGGKDIPESSLDAIYKIVEDIEGSFPDAHTKRTRIVVVFTDAPPKEIRKETIGGDFDGLDMLIQNFKSSHVKLFLYAPVHDYYADFSNRVGSDVTYNVINPQGEDAVEALKTLNFEVTIKTLAKTVSQMSII